MGAVDLKLRQLYISVQVWNRLNSQITYIQVQSANSWQHLECDVTGQYLVAVATECNN